MMESFSKKACHILVGISPCTWQLEESDCIYLTSGKDPCGLDSEEQSRILKAEDTKSPTDKNH